MDRELLPFQELSKAQQWEEEADNHDKWTSPFVESSRKQIIKALELVGTTSKDTVVGTNHHHLIFSVDCLADLGCGQGSVLIAAVEDLHVNMAVGIDVNPILIEEARQLADALPDDLGRHIVLYETSLPNRVDEDFSEILEKIPKGSIVYLYLLPKQLETLKPLLSHLVWHHDCRIVSNRFLVSYLPLIAHCIFQQSAARNEEDFNIYCYGQGEKPTMTSNK